MCARNQSNASELSRKMIQSTEDRSCGDAQGEHQSVLSDLLVEDFFPLDIVNASLHLFSLTALSVMM